MHAAPLDPNQQETTGLQLREAAAAKPRINWLFHDQCRPDPPDRSLTPMLTAAHHVSSLATALNQLNMQQQQHS